MIRLSDILHKVEGYHPSPDLDLVQRAYVFANKAHEGQMRRSGDPYVTHPLSVALVIAELRLDVPSICAGLLHDCVEDTTATIEDLQRLFGDEIAFLVDGVTKLGKVSWRTKEDRQAENFRKMLLAMAKDIRVILIKLADRTDNMRTLEHMPADKQERIAQETLDIYAPLANRLGMQAIKCELEDLSFRYLLPSDYEALRAKLEAGDAPRQQYIDRAASAIRDEMARAGLPCQVSGRIKHLWSTWAKMRRDQRALEQVHDLVAFRVMTQSVRDCYAALGVIHSTWTPIPGRFKDYIALPKPNMYQSLHTSVIGPQGERMEVQIRTDEMDRVAQEGIAAHWKYKAGKGGIDAKDEKKFAWLRQLMEWQRDLKDPNEFIETVKIDLFEDEVYVFTPKGDVKALAKGATPIDFAYSIHSVVGNHCSGARVNGLMVPLRYKLRNGDTVEIMTNPQQKPSKDWLGIVATSRAKARIRAEIRAVERARSLQLGRDLLERELRRVGMAWNRAEKQGLIAKAVAELKTQTLDELLALIGFGKFTAAQVVESIVPEPERKAPLDEAPKDPIRKLLRKVMGGRTTGTGIQVEGENDVLVRFAKCCNPVPGDPIIGFITRGRGVAVHLRECPKAIDLDPDRRIEVTWGGKSKASRPVQLRVQSGDKPGLLAEMSRAFAHAGVNIAQANCRTVDGKAVNTFLFGVEDLEQLKGVIRELQKIDGVFAVERVAAEQ